MEFWYYFWLADFVIAAAAFAIISLVVLIKGTMELREMFARLQGRRSGDPSQSD